MMKVREKVLGSPQEVLTALRSRLPIFHKSNLFFRDVQFGLQALLAADNARISNRDAEALARTFVEALEKGKLLLPIDHQTWMVNNPDFQTATRKR